jgi:hypothetical protein
MSLLLAAAAAAHFNYYPGFIEPGHRVDALIDKGPIVELVVRCKVGTGIIAISKYEGLFCAPDFTCFSTLRPAIARTCR